MATATCGKVGGVEKECKRATDRRVTLVNRGFSAVVEGTLELKRILSGPPPIEPSGAVPHEKRESEVRRRDATVIDGWIFGAGWKGPVFPDRLNRLAVGRSVCQGSIRSGRKKGTICI